MTEGEQMIRARAVEAAEAIVAKVPDIDDLAYLQFRDAPSLVAYNEGVMDALGALLNAIGITHPIDSECIGALMLR